jgi:hypothetical protein
MCPVYRSVTITKWIIHQRVQREPILRSSFHPTRQGPFTVNHRFDAPHFALPEPVISALERARYMTPRYNNIGCGRETGDYKNFNSDTLFTYKQCLNYCSYNRPLLCRTCTIFTILILGVWGGKVHLHRWLFLVCGFYDPQLRM